MPARRNDKNFPTALRYRPYLLAECGAGWNSLLPNGFGNFIVISVYRVDVLLSLGFEVSLLVAATLPVRRVLRNGAALGVMVRRHLDQLVPARHQRFCCLREPLVQEGGQAYGNIRDSGDLRKKDARQQRSAENQQGRGAESPERSG